MRLFYDKIFYILIIVTNLAALCYALFFSERKLLPEFEMPAYAFKDSTVHFFEKTEGAVTWLWDFGDNTQKSTLRNPEHIYHIEGGHPITLTVNNRFSASKRILIIRIPELERPPPITDKEWTTLFNNVIDEGQNSDYILLTRYLKMTTPVWIKESSQDFIDFYRSLKDDKRYIINAKLTWDEKKMNIVRIEVLM